MSDSEKREPPAPDGAENGADAKTPEGGMENDLAASITMAFNLGVSANQQAKGTKSIAQILSELGQHIFTGLSKQYGEKAQQEQIIANTEYLLQIALMGYIVPSICDYEENFKERLLSLIESRAKKQAPGGGEGEKSGGTIITP
ncbi:MAG: hypothetical protein ACR2NQ_00330 [Thermodesulfobacteriota bacterium]